MGVAASASAALTFTVNRLDSIPRSTPLIYTIVLLAGLVGGRVVSRALDSATLVRAASGDERIRARARRVVVVGVDRFATLAIKLVQAQAPRAVEIVAVLDPSGRLIGRAVQRREDRRRAGRSVADRRRNTRSTASKSTRSWLSDAAVAQWPPTRSGALLAACDAAGLRCAALSRALNLVPAPIRRRAERRGGLAPRSRRPRCIFSSSARLTRSAPPLLLVLLAPVAAAVAAIVAFDVGAPVVFWQERIGRNGRRFLLYKFRTYRAPFDREGRAVPREARMSNIGALVRKSRFDEIPQLWNILRGEMSLIGPRPLLPVDQPEDARDAAAGSARRHRLGASQRRDAADGGREGRARRLVHPPRLAGARFARRAEDHRSFVSRRAQGRSGDRGGVRLAAQGAGARAPRGRRSPERSGGGGRGAAAGGRALPPHRSDVVSGGPAAYGRPTLE